MASAKRQRLDEPADAPSIPQSLHRAISPPPPSAKMRKRNVDFNVTAQAQTQLQAEKQELQTAARRIISSPFQLTKIRDLSPDMNVDAVSLADLLGDPLIAECWEFNYLHDVDFLLSHFDEDTRALVKVHIVHGFWKQDDWHRKSLEVQASRHSNVWLHTAHMPEMFGTHHSKMMILFRHDDTVQVIICTANMIAKDWTNLTNAVWRSPLLPLLPLSPLAPLHAVGPLHPEPSSVQNETLPAEPEAASSHHPPSPVLTIGSGFKFKHDLLNYLRAYNSRRDVCKPLVEQLCRYDFSAVRGALIASVPGKHEIEDSEDTSSTSWGWAAVKKTMRSVPVQASGEAELVVQVSSIATLGPTDTWLRGTLLAAFTSPTKSPSVRPTFSIVFPTPHEIRRSLDGYASGGSIHMKIQSPQQAKQLQYMRPMLCHWTNDDKKGTASPRKTMDAGRQRAAPHIKTYIRYHKDSETIDWALFTSANISVQAWGKAGNTAGDIQIASWEIGVMVWPELLSDDPGARMIGTFKTDMPCVDDDGGDNGANPTLVGLRMPYNLPLRRYGANEVPWVATAKYSEPDRKGKKWT